MTSAWHVLTERSALHGSSRPSEADVQEATAAFEEAARLMPDAPKYRRSVEALAAAVEENAVLQSFTLYRVRLATA